MSNISFMCDIHQVTSCLPKKKYKVLLVWDPVENKDVGWWTVPAAAPISYFQQHHLFQLREVNRARDDEPLEQTNCEKEQEACDKLWEASELKHQHIGNAQEANEDQQELDQEAIVKEQSMSQMAKEDCQIAIESCEMEQESTEKEQETSQTEQEASEMEQEPMQVSAEYCQIEQESIGNQQETSPKEPAASDKNQKTGQTEQELISLLKLANQYEQEASVKEQQPHQPGQVANNMEQEVVQMDYVHIEKKACEKGHKDIQMPHEEVQMYHGDIHMEQKDIQMDVVEIEQLVGEEQQDTNGMELELKEDEGTQHNVDISQERLFKCPELYYAVYNSDQESSDEDDVIITEIKEIQEVLPPPADYSNSTLLQPLPQLRDANRRESEEERKEQVKLRICEEDLVNKAITTVLDSYRNEGKEVDLDHVEVKTSCLKAMGESSSSSGGVKRASEYDEIMRKKCRVDIFNVLSVDKQIRINHTCKGQEESIIGFKNLNNNTTFPRVNATHICPCSCVPRYLGTSMIAGREEMLPGRLITKHLKDVGSVFKSVSAVNEIPQQVEVAEESRLQEALLNMEEKQDSIISKSGGGKHFK